MTEGVEFALFIFFPDCNEYKNSCSFSPQSYFVKVFPTKIHQRRLIRFLISLCLCKITNQKLNT